MQLFTTSKTLDGALRNIRTSQTIGFVPTMGALHEGHLSLVRNSKKVADKTVVSIFVNPTQFDREEDLINYPSTFQSDIELLQQESCDYVFVPTIEEMYSDHIEAQDFDFDGLDKLMEGAHRQGHFNGVGTIVKRLFEIVQPDFAFFGEKDFQQLQIIKKLVEKEQFPIQIIGVPIFRESDGLAMSSRNARLTDVYRQAAPFIYKTLQEAKKVFGTKSALETIEWVENTFKKHSLLKLEYFSIANEVTLLPISTNSKNDSNEVESNQKYRGFIAVFAGDIRLIDNIALY